MQPATRTYLGILMAQAKLSYDCEYAGKWEIGQMSRFDWFGLIRAIAM